MKNKGFTLIELMGVIVILSIIAIIAIPTIDRQLKEGREDLSENQLENIKTSARLWASDNTDKLPESGDVCYLRYSNLVTSGYVDEKLIDINSSVELSDSNLQIEIKNANSNKYEYNVTFDQNGITTPDKYCDN